MSKKEAKFLVIAPAVGDGNHISGVSIAKLIADSMQIFDAIPQQARIKNEQINPNSLTFKELENYDQLRTGLASMTYGLMTLCQFLIEQRGRFSRLADVGIFVKEDFLSITPNWLLPRWFPKGVFLAVPDVEPKNRGIKVLEEKKGVVVPIVWNRQAFDNLKGQQGLRPVLAAPFLPEGFVGEIDFAKKGLKEKIVVKPLGSGIPEEWIQKIKHYVQVQNLTLEIWLPARKITIVDDQEIIEEFDKEVSLEDYVSHFYQSLANEPPRFLVSYPLEMVQVAAWMRSRGWRGNFLTLPPSATHKNNNLQWAKKFLQAKEIDFDPKSNPFSYQEISRENIERLREQLGRLPLKEIINHLQTTNLFDNSRHPWINRYNNRERNYWKQIINQLLVKYLKKEFNEFDFFYLNPEEQIRIMELLIQFGKIENKNLIFKFTCLLLKKLTVLGKVNFFSQLKTLTERDFYQIIFDGLASKFEEEGQTKKWRDVFEFGFAKNLFELSDQFFEFFENNFDFIRGFYKNSQGEYYKRKVNEGLYLRHILRTVVNADLLYQQLKSREDFPEDFDYQVLFMVSALHDAIEINQKGDELNKKDLTERLMEIGFEQKKAEKICKLVQFITPPTKNKNQPYFDSKKYDFDRIWEGEELDEEIKKWWETNKWYLRIIKAADVMVNLEETVGDLQKGREDGKMARSLEERYQVFAYRVEKIKETFGSLTLLKNTNNLIKELQKDL